MRRLFNIIISTIALLLVSCEEETSTDIDVNVNEIKSLRIIFKSIIPVINYGSEYWQMEEDFQIDADSIFISGDTLKFTDSLYSVNGFILININNGNLDLFQIYLNHHWTRYWYDYSVPKWDPNYYRQDPVDNIFKITTLNIPRIDKGFNYFIKSEDLNGKSTILIDLVYNSILFSESNQLILSDKSQIEIIFNE